MKYILSLFIIFSILSFSPKTKTVNMNRFCEYLQGEYNSEKQAKLDTSYFNISLVILPIWNERKDGNWFYVEQAMAAKTDKPYRQRVYQIKYGNYDTIISVIYQFDSALNYAQLYKNDPKMTKLTYDKITSKDGCEVYMIPQDDGSFKGGTKGKNCPSSLKGAKYATTEVTLAKTQLLSWDRGYDSLDKHVWGAEKGGYVFDKKN